MLQKKMYTLLILMLSCTAAYGMSSSNSPLVERASDLGAKAVNKFWKITGWVDPEYAIGTEATALYNHEECRVEIAFARGKQQTYKDFVADPRDGDAFTIAYQIRDRVTVLWGWVPEWIRAGNQANLSHFVEHDRIIAPPILRYLAQVWLAQQDSKPQQTTLQPDEHGLLEKIALPLPAHDKTPTQLQEIIEEAPTQVIAPYSLAGAERLARKIWSPEDYICAKAERRKSEELYTIGCAYIRDAEATQQPIKQLLDAPNGKFATHLHQIAERSMRSYDIITGALRGGALEKVRKIYKTHGATIIPPILALLMCDMRRCSGDVKYLPAPYLAHYNDVATDPLLNKTVGKFIFLLCNQLTPNERQDLWNARATILATQSDERVAAVFSSIKRDEQNIRRTLLTNINATGNMERLFNRLEQFITGVPAKSPASLRNSSQDITSHAASSTPMDIPSASPVPMTHEVGSDGLMYPVLSPATPER